jgi:uncharacterized repeat protein (TIGR02543 family)
MKKQTIIFAVTIFCLIFIGCEAMADLFHGPKPKPAPETYTVTFDANGATNETAPQPITAAKGSVITLPNEVGLSIDGNTFGGWNTSAAGTGDHYTAGSPYTVNEDVTLYAKWDKVPPEYRTVTFYTDGGSSISAQMVIAGSMATRPADPTKNGYTFGNWYSDEGLTTLYDFSTPVTVHINLFAKWIPNTYTVTFDKNNTDLGSTEASPQTGTVTYPEPLGTLPEPPTRPGYTFTGWNKLANGTGEAVTETTAVNANITVYAQWKEGVIVPGATVAAQLAWLNANAASNFKYFLTAYAAEGLSPKTLSYPGKTDVTVYLESNTEPQTLSLTGNGSLFTVDAGVELVLENIVLRGRENNNAPLVKVTQDGKLVLKSGGKVTGNTYVASVNGDGGAGIFVDGGTLEIAGGEVSGNTAKGSIVGIIRGGGIQAVNSSTVLMIGGTIRDNLATNTSTSGLGDALCSGGGIALGNNSLFKMIDGVIEGNTVNVQSTNMGANGGGGGVDIIYTSSFYLEGGAIKKNTVNAVSGNQYSASLGGGVSVGAASNFVMSGGIISGNSATSSVGNSYYYVNSIWWYLGAYGGGIFLQNLVGGRCTFEKTGGIIYGNEVAGNDAGSIPLKNTAQGSGGHAVYSWIGSGNADPRRNTTAYATNNMDSGKTGAAGGW